MKDVRRAELRRPLSPKARPVSHPAHVVRVETATSENGYKRPGAWLAHRENTHGRTSYVKMFQICY